MARLDRFKPLSFSEEQAIDQRVIMDDEDAHEADKQALRREILRLEQTIEEYSDLNAKLLEDKRQLRIQLEEKLCH